MKKTVFMAKKSTKKNKKVSKSKKKTPEPDYDSITEKSEFCTECDKDLDNFWMDKRSYDPEKVKKNHERCVKTGKFRGEFCAKLFIISPDDTGEEWFKDE